MTKASLPERVTLDTNVAIVANGRDTHASLACQLASIEALERARERQQTLIDTADHLFSEYRKHLSYSGQPGIGDAFFLHLHRHQGDPRHVERVPITPSDETRGFDELPPNSLDPSDRKFLAVALVGRGRLVNATDSDWHEQQVLLDQLDVEIEQLCPEHAHKPHA